MKKKYDIAIIGSGISGMTSAILLARAGKSVAIFEKHYKVGGYLHSFNRFGVEFDTGAHYIGAMESGGAFRVLLDYLNVYNENHYREMAKDGFDRFYISGKIYKFSCGYEKTINDLSKDFPLEATNLKLYFDLLQRISKLIPTYNFSTSFDTTEIFKWMETSLEEVVSSFIKDENLRMVLYAYCALHGVHPREAPFAPHAVITDTLICGAYTFKQSGEDLAKSFEKECIKLGVDIFLREEVVSFNVEDKMITSFSTKNNIYEADNIISSLHPKLTFSMLSQDPSSRTFKSKLNSMKESVGIVAVYLTLNSHVEIDPDCNLYFFEDTLDDIFSYGNPFKPRMMYLCRPGRSNEVDYNLKHKFLTIHVPCHFSYVKMWENTKFGKRPDDYKDFKLEIGQSIIRKLENYLPGISKNVEQMEVSTPITNLHYNGSVEGSAYGIYHSIENTGLKGLNPRTKLSNLYLTGQNISFPGIQSSCTAGLRTAGMIIGIKSILRDLEKLK